MRNLIFTYFFLSSLLALGQAKIEFEKTTHDFGAIVEHPDGATYKFKFKNVGKEPLVISSARPSCGCTVPTWTQEPVMPGETGEINARYNSLGRIGSFNKSITVESNSAENPVIYLTIKGDVKAKPAESGQAIEAESLPEHMLPEISLLKNEFSFGKIQVGEKLSQVFHFKNTGASDLVIRDVISDCKCTQFKVDKAKIKPGEEGSITLTYSPNQESANGETLNILINAPDKGRGKVTLKGQVVKKLVQNSPVQKTNGNPFK
jgi:hypothetical protein